MSTINTTSKRQRFLDIVKTAKESYIPTIQSTVTQLASEARSKAINYTESFQNINGVSSKHNNTSSTQDQQRQLQYDNNGGYNKNEFRGASIVVYPHYTRYNVDEDKISYATQVHGLVFHTEGETRKKKIFLKLAKQLVRTKGTTNGDYEEKLKDFNRSVCEFNEDETVISTHYNKRPGTADSDDSSVTTTSSDSYSEDVLKERISAFFNKSLANIELTIAIGGETRDELQVQQLITDQLGNFNTEVITDFKPTFMQVAVTQDEKIFTYKESFFPGDSAYGIITDIDDTIKKTGVCGDKRSLFRNCFVDDLQTWEIPGAAPFLKKFDSFGMPIFYVSNSPYQFFDNLTKFFEFFQFPVGSMYLKKYSGNFLGSMWEPSHVRKKAALDRIISHYGDKKFFLIGDSGEQDLEAYTDLAKSYPDKVMGIFIRVADNSMTEDTYSQIQRILNDTTKKNKNSKHGSGIVVTKNNIPKTQSVFQYYNEKDDLIDLDPELIYDSHLLALEKQSKEKSEMILDEGLTLEKEGDDSSFFIDSRPPPAPSRKPPIPSKPEHLRRKPPPIPKKPRYLQTNFQSSQDSNNSSETVNQSVGTIQKRPSSPIDQKKEPPLLPQRPIPTPPTHRSSNNSYLHSIPSSPISDGYNQYLLNSPMVSHVKMLPYCTIEKTDEWLGRIFTSKLVLEKLSVSEDHAKDIKLYVFKNYDDVMKEVELILKKDNDLQETVRDLIDL